MRVSFTRSGVVYSVLGILYLAAGLFYLHMVAQWTGVSTGPDFYDSAELARYVWTARYLGIGAVVFLALIFGYFKRVGCKVPESLFLLLFLIIELSFITSVYSTLGML